MSPEIDQVNSRCQWQPFKLVQIWSTLLFLLIVVIAKQDNILVPVKKKLAKHYNPSVKEVTLALFEADLQMTCKKQAFVVHMDWVLTQNALFGCFVNIAFMFKLNLPFFFQTSLCFLSNPLPPFLLAEAVHKVSLLVKEFPTKSVQTLKLYNNIWWFGEESISISKHSLLSDTVFGMQLVQVNNGFFFVLCKKRT